jgi:hypothetical protein
MKAIKTQKTQKHLIIALSMLLFLLANANSLFAQESTGNPSTTPYSTQLPVEITKAAPITTGANILISYSFPKPMNVELVMYDNSGNELKTLVNNTQQAGSYSVDLKAAKFKKGVYFYRLTINGSSSVNKIVLTK